ncbi:uncharacterized protein [Asterias amurensis]|uniref:uncharacterized protein n=1 Tax=Asterias amurensis TaxID=7602 RepID=UPI003AB1136C
MFHPSNSSATLKQSQPMPKWLWICIAKSLGIKTHPGDKPILATILYAFTMTVTLAYFITSSWYVGYDIEATTTKFDVLNGSVTVLMAAGFCCVTIYANNLAYKLFTNTVFRQSLRLHSKTILKVNTSLLMVILSTLFIGIYTYICYSGFEAKHCEDIQLSPIICYIRFPSQIALSVISFIWNMLVAVVCMSVCRTHTISIRHLLLELDEDAMICEKGNRIPSVSGDSIDGEQQAENISNGEHEASFQDDLAVRRLEVAWDRSELERRQYRISSSHYDVSRSVSMQDTVVEQDLPDSAGNQQEGLQWRNASIVSGFIHTPAIKSLTNPEILDRYWKLQCRLNTTSIVLQRWITSWIVLILLWSLYYLMYWIDHDATIADMIIFFIPPSLLPLLCSGPIEVNGEGERVSKMICPSEKRMPVIMFIRQAPLSITLYGFSLNYSTIVTAILAIAVAFGTKIIFGNINMDGQTPSPSLGPVTPF